MPQIYVAGKAGGPQWDVIPKHPMITYVSSDVERGEGPNLFRSDDIKKQVKSRCVEQIKSSEWLFAYLDDTTDCYESIAEIAFASALNIPCLVTMAVNSESDTYNAYSLVGNFPRVLIVEGRQPEHAAFFYGLNLGVFVCESEIEKELWWAITKLSPRSLDYKIPCNWPIPQFAISRYRLDFAWPNQKLAVEVDGHDYHKTKEQRSYDAQRDRDLLRLGWTTVRFTGSDVFRNADGVAKEIMSIVDGGKREDEH